MTGTRGSRANTQLSVNCVLREKGRKGREKGRKGREKGKERGGKEKRGGESRKKNIFSIISFFRNKWGYTKAQERSGDLCKNDS